MVQDEHPLVGPPKAVAHVEHFAVGWYSAQEGRLGIVTDKEQVLEATDHIDLPR